MTCLGSRNEINQKILLKEKENTTIISTSLGEFSAEDRMLKPEGTKEIALEEAQSSSHHGNLT
ncbi:hypothetical protein SFRURICE_021534 [Spodoptera frugiperda]|nr:hypothetical protein SFRURICE_021534 [Spodoptera frugiperda]